MSISEVLKCGIAFYYLQQSCLELLSRSQISNHALPCVNTWSGTIPSRFRRPFWIQPTKGKWHWTPEELGINNVQLLISAMITYCNVVVSMIRRNLMDRRDLTWYRNTSITANSREAKNLTVGVYHAQLHLLHWSEICETKASLTSVRIGPQPHCYLKSLALEICGIN